jgi:hypothetical protein
MRMMLPWLLSLSLVACTGDTDSGDTDTNTDASTDDPESDEDTGSAGTLAVVQFAAIFGYEAETGKLRTVTTESQGAIPPVMQFIAATDIGVQTGNPDELCGVAWTVNNGASAPAWISEVDGFTGIGKTALPSLPAGADQCKGWYAWPEDYKLPGKLFEGTDLGFAITELDPDVKDAFGPDARDALGVVLRSSLIGEDQIMGLAFAYPVDEDWNQSSEDYMDADEAVVDGKAVTAMYQLNIQIESSTFTQLFAPAE